MFIKKLIKESVGVIIRNITPLLIIYLYIIFCFLSIHYDGFNDYTSMYTLNLFVAFILSCIGCRENNLKIVRFDFQFRMAFSYLILLLIYELHMLSLSKVNIYFPKFIETVYSIAISISPDMDYAFFYKGSLGVFFESLIYGLLSPLLYLLVSFCFSIKNILSISITKLLIGNILFLINGISFASLALPICMTDNQIGLYLYVLAIATYHMILVVLTYVVGKNSFAENTA